MGKQLCLLENSDQGKCGYQFFMEVEKKKDDVMGVSTELEIVELVDGRGDEVNNFDLIPIKESEFNGEQVLTVDARGLHRFLCVGRHFGSWIVERIVQYDFKKNIEYWVYPDSGKNPLGGRPSKEYALSIDMCKELCMVENNEQGKKARQYFIECERRLRVLDVSRNELPISTSDDVIILKGYSLLMEKVEHLEKRVELQAAKIEEDEPKVVYADALMVAEGYIQVGELAVILRHEGFDIGRGRLLRFLRVTGMLINRGSRRNLPSQLAVSSGYFMEAIKTYVDKYGNTHSYGLAMVSPKGQQYYLNLFRNKWPLVSERRVKPKKSLCVLSKSDFGIIGDEIS
jgi:phage anti-repressor protein/phage antirepressor YoqD-like protein